MLTPGAWAQACLHGMACAEEMTLVQHCDSAGSQEARDEVPPTVSTDCCRTVTGDESPAPEAVTTPGTLLPSPEKGAVSGVGPSALGQASTSRWKVDTGERSRARPAGRDLLQLHQTFLN